MYRSKKNILVIVAHPDDEVLGCGGTIAKYAREGHIVHVAFLADGVSSRNHENPTLYKSELESRRKAASAACSALGVTSISFGDLPDNQLDTVPQLKIAKIVEGILLEHKPEVLITHHSGDLNIDHRCVHRAVAVACRPLLNCTVKTILCIEIPSSTEWQLPGSFEPFIPNWFEDISRFVEIKKTALSLYTDEIREWPHPRSEKAIENLAQWRGSSVGFEAAEAFVMVRNLA